MGVDLWKAKTECSKAPRMHRVLTWVTANPEKLHGLGFGV